MYLLHTTTYVIKICYRHEREKHQDIPADSGSNEEPSEEKNEDHKYNYHVTRLFYGLFMEDINDAIREGDSERLLDCIKLSLLVFRKFRKDKYAYTTLLFLCKLFAILPEKEAFHLLRNRFFNGKGGKGNNIPLDLLNEFFNHLLKTCLRSLGGNINEVNAQRVARSLCLMQKTLASVDCDISMAEKSGKHNVVAAEESVSQIVRDLTHDNVSLASSLEEWVKKVFPSLAKISLKGLTTEIFFPGQGGC